MSEFKKIEKISPETLLGLVREVLDTSNDFEYINGDQPFFMSFLGKKYYVYVKNISSAYFSDRDKTTRAQLPIKPKFDIIKASPYPFIFLGYDVINDVLVCWNYHIAKQRLNVGKSVSFYSRTYFQSEVKKGEFLRNELKNGDLPVFFKRQDLVDFFKNIESFFPNDTVIYNVGEDNIDAPSYKVEEKDIVSYGKLIEIHNTELLQKLKPYIESNRLLSAAQIVGEYYELDYPKMELSDWINLVRNIKF